MWTEETNRFHQFREEGEKDSVVRENTNDVERESTNLGFGK